MAQPHLPNRALGCPIHAETVVLDLVQHALILVPYNAILALAHHVRLPYKYHAAALGPGSLKSSVSIMSGVQTHCLAARYVAAP